mmetsp:Transcript_78141/g.253585  ORF Transcript_78141/g.253585 Transcript_78141/m.253585 type:complete len:207 (+) Transcript_78141:4479-5099(+)
MLCRQPDVHKEADRGEQLCRRKPKQELGHQVHGVRSAGCHPAGECDGRGDSGLPRPWAVADTPHDVAHLFVEVTACAGLCVRVVGGHARLSRAGLGGVVPLAVLRHVLGRGPCLARHQQGRAGGADALLAGVVLPQGPAFAPIETGPTRCRSRGDGPGGRTFGGVAWAGRSALVQGRHGPRACAGPARPPAERPWEARVRGSDLPH